MMETVINGVLLQKLMDGPSKGVDIERFIKKHKNRSIAFYNFSFNFNYNGNCWFF